MQLDGIDVFVEVVEARSFSKAAQRLRMPPATVSAKIARLEEKLGVTLIQRTTRKLHVTDAGEAYYRSCARAVSELREAEQQLTASTNQPAGCLRLTAPLDLSQSILPPIIERFIAEHPLASIELIVTNRKADLLADGIDLALRVGPLSDSRLIARKVFVGHACLWASKAYVAKHGAPEKPEDLARHTFLGLSLQFPKSMHLRSRKKILTLPGAPRIKCDDVEALRRFIVRGNGIGILPAHLGVEDGLVAILPDYKSPATAASLVYPAQRFVPPIVRAFIACAAQSPN